MRGECDYERLISVAVISSRVVSSLEETRRNDDILCGGVVWTSDVYDRLIPFFGQKKRYPWTVAVATKEYYNWVNLLAY